MTAGLSRATRLDKGLALLNGVGRLIRDIAGLDRVMAYTIGARLIGLAAVPVTLLMIARFLSPAEQGYYYTFSSILGVTMFFDLGLTNVLMVYASHEKPFLSWTALGGLDGDRVALARLASIFRFGVGWFRIAAALMLVIVYPIGLWFFGRGADTGFAWRVPWLMAVCVTAFTMLLAPVMPMIEGCGRVREVRFLGMITPLLAYPVLWGVLFAGWGLFAGPAFFGTSLVVAVLWLLVSHRRFVSVLWRSASGDASISFGDIWPMQWRTSLSWLSGYLAFQLFNPVLFALHGPEVAGRMGMTLSLTQTVGGLGLAWVVNKAPLFGNLWAEGRHKDLDREFFTALTRGMAFTIIGVAGLSGLVVFLNFAGHEYAGRVLPPLPFTLMAVVQVFNTVVFAESFYLRANKREPFLWVSLGYGTLVLASNWFLGGRYGVSGMAAGYLAVAILNFSASTLVFIRMKRIWQSGDGR